jgi:EmrB/QacA subfamily drug resistance transporter
MSLLLVGMDVTIVNVALPSIQNELNATIPQLQWIVDAYTLVVASLLVLSGSMADRFGRRRVFQIGLGLFTAGSCLCSLANTAGALIGFRGVQALGASMLNPVALSIITNTFHEPKQRARAVGIWGGVVGLAMAIGPLAGGALTQSIGWRSVFWVNLPIGIAAMLLTRRFVPESKAAHARPVDPVGQALATTALLSLTSAIIEGNHSGWDSPLIITLFAIAAISILFFIRYERRCATPLLDLRFFRSIPFRSATLIALCAFAALSGFLFLNALYLQHERGLSAFHTGLCTLPIALMVMIGSPLSGRLVGTYGTRPSLLVAGTGIFISGVILSQLGPDTPLLVLLTSYTIFGIGFGTVNAPITNTAVSGMPKAQAGVAAAIASTSRQVGAALGVALAGTIVSTGRMRGLLFSAATHPFWWLMAGCGGMIFLLGFVSNSIRAKASIERIAHLMDAPVH